jgi:hypothetical protein
MLLSYIGGLLQGFVLIFGFVRRIARSGFRLQAIKEMYIVTTKTQCSFTQPKKEISPEEYKNYWKIRISFCNRLLNYMMCTCCDKKFRKVLKLGNQKAKKEFDALKMIFTIRKLKLFARQNKE